MTSRIKIPVMRGGYIQFIEPFMTHPGERYLMFGHHGNFTPVYFHDPL